MAHSHSSVPSTDNCLRTRAAGRLCLLGEHADYLGLEVISFPLDRALVVEGRPIPGREWILRLRDLGQTRRIVPDGLLPIEGPEDYLAAGMNRLLRTGLKFETAFDVTISSFVPLKKGISSSSAFCVAWMDFLHRAATPSRICDPAELAEQAYGLEVIDFQQSGGMQDHYTIAFGRLVHLNCRQPVQVSPLPARLQGFVLGDSGSTKDTQGVLGRIRSTVERAVKRLGWSLVQLREVSEPEARYAAMELDEAEAELLVGTVMNRDQVRYGRCLLEGSLEDSSSQLELGRLLAEHHHILRARLQTSTPAIDEALQVARRAGALGGKVLGSGGGGCFLVYAPGRTAEVVAALNAASFRARTVAPTAVVQP